MPWRRAALSFALLLTLSCASCVTHLYRLGEPAAVERVGLDAGADDRALIHVVHSLFPRQRERLLLAVPHGWETAAVAQRAAGSIDLELRARCGVDGALRVLGTVPSPPT